MTAPAMLSDIRRLDERIDELEPGSVSLSMVEIMSFRDGDVLHAHVPGNVDMDQAQRARDHLQSTIGDFVEARTGAKIRVVVTTGDVSMSVIRKEDADDPLPD